MKILVEFKINNERGEVVTKRGYIVNTYRCQDSFCDCATVILEDGEIVTKAIIGLTCIDSNYIKG